MSDSGEERINLFNIATGPIKHYNYDGSFFCQSRKVTAETVGYPPDEWDAIMSQDSQNRQRPPVTPSPDGEPNDKVLYKPIRGEYEIRVLEIKPGSGNETLRGALHRYPVSCMKRLARALARTGTSVKWCGAWKVRNWTTNQGFAQHYSSFLQRFDIQTVMIQDTGSMVFSESARTGIRRPS